MKIEKMTTESLPRSRFSGFWKITRTRRSGLATPMLRQLEKIIMLQTIDTLWKDHLLNMDHLKEGIGLRGYGQKNRCRSTKKRATTCSRT